MIFFSWLDFFAFIAQPNAKTSGLPPPAPKPFFASLFYLRFF
jgi:hypothetical protein